PRSGPRLCPRADRPGQTGPPPPLHRRRCRRLRTRQRWSEWPPHLPSGPPRAGSCPPPVRVGRPMRFAVPAATGFGHSVRQKATGTRLFRSESNSVAWFVSDVMAPVRGRQFGSANFAVGRAASPSITHDRPLKSSSIPINTTDPAYYQWTQWIFLQFFKAGLAYQAEIPINWCPFEKIGLANEEVERSPRTLR